MTCCFNVYRHKVKKLTGNSKYRTSRIPIIRINAYFVTTKQHMKLFIHTMLFILVFIAYANAQDVKPFKDTNNKYGLKDGKGNIIVSAKYNFINDFNNGLARVCVGSDYANWLFGFIDSRGKEVIPVKYQQADGFSEGLANVKLNGKNGFLDPSGNVAIPLIYDNASYFSEGLAAVRTGDYTTGKWSYIDKNGKTVLAMQYDAANAFKDGIALISIQGKYGFINKSGKQVIAAEYDYAYEFYDGLAAVNKGGIKGGWNVTGGKWGFINKSGKMVIPLQYDFANPFAEGLACVMNDKKAGFIDVTGKLVIPMQFETMSSFQYGKAPVTLNGKSIFIDKTGAASRSSKKVTFNNGEYIGETGSDGITPNGKGKMVWKAGDIYEGDWVNGQMNGKGKLTQSGKEYEGSFVNGKFMDAVTKAPVIILNEEFNDNNNNWPVGSNNDAVTQISNGQYLFEMKNEYYYFNWMPGTILSKIDQAKDFVMETQITVLSGNENYPVWFLWAHKDMATQYSFQIMATGKYEYDKKINNNVTVLIPAETSSAIKQGKNVANKIRIQKQGSNIEFYINDVFVDKAVYESFDPFTTVGFLLQNNKKIAVDYVRITQ